jgi:dihydrolipoamide dehydrogenase
MTSKEALELREIPERLAVIGGGVIGMEMAEIYRSLGASVTVFEGEKQILSQIDSDLAKRLQLSLKKKGLCLETGTLVKKIEAEGTTFLLHSEKKNKEKVDTFDAVLVATGRRPNTEGLGLDRLGIAMDRGAVLVNDAFETSVPGIYAIGDVNGRCLLAHAASHQGIDVMERIAGHHPEINHALFPNCIFIEPEIATCGLSEDQAKAAGIAVKVAKVPFAGNGKALALGKTEGLVKIIASEDDVILGCQIMGQGASIMIHEAMVAIDRKMTAKQIHQIIHAHPTLSETFMEAVAAIGGEAIHQIPKKKKER